jgi:peptidoglycan/xylan/chitin deacetylase (PgdA/CDA1 family)
VAGGRIGGGHCCTNATQLGALEERRISTVSAPLGMEFADTAAHLARVVPQISQIRRGGYRMDSRSLVHGVAQVLTARGPDRLFRRLLSGRGVIFMLHRFRTEERLEGHDPEAVRRALACLRSRGYALVTLEDMFRRLREGNGEPVGGIAFTMDDGYRDQATVGLDAFAAFDVPVTMFVTSGFLDRRLWMWWDRIECVFRQSGRGALPCPLGPSAPLYDLSTEPARRRSQALFTERCKAVPEQAKLEAIAALAGAAEVELPETAPPEYAPMSWDELRAAERRGMSFGPHTVTHPILARVDDATAAAEIGGSWSRLREEASSAVPVFCYPNGQPGDFGPREWSILNDVGLDGAVTGIAGYAEAGHVRRTPHGRYTVARFSWSDDLGTVLQAAVGLERAKAMVRGMGKEAGRAGLVA